MPELLPLGPGEQAGGCQCGGIRFAAPNKPLALYACHCTECRKQSSAAFGISFTITRDALRLLQGVPAYWSRRTASGHSLECAFCPTCGSRVWHQSSGHPATLNIKGGSLDTALDMSDAVHIWTASKLPGVCIPPGARSFPGEPDREH
ncbi:MAG: GFA family protein [Steroidobacteraceae bacterium]